MSQKKILAINTIVLVLLAFSSCVKQPRKVELVSDINSYSTVVEIESYLNRTIFDKKGDPNTVLTLNAQFEHFECKGTAKFLFFENQLCSIGFFPDDSARYLSKISEMLGYDLVKGDSILLDGLLVERGFDNDLLGRDDFFVAWTDKLLKSRYNNRVWKTSD